MTRKTVKGQRDERSAKISFEEWDLLDDDEINQLITRCLRKGFEIATKDYECHAWFPAEWDFGNDPSDGVGGKPPADPTTIYVELPIGPNEDDSPRWMFTLNDLISTLIDATSVDGKIADDHARSATAIMNGLREQADRIEKALKG